jgi:hypothetical protein
MASKAIKLGAAPGGVKKTECPITRADFQDGAKALRGELGGLPFIIGAKEFSTGSFGWGTSEKVTLEVNGVPVKVQLSINATVIGSKDAK